MMWVVANGIAPTAATEKLTRVRTVMRHPIGGARIAANRFVKKHSTFVTVQGEEFYTLFGYYCDTDLRWELAEEIGRLPYLYSLLLA